MHVDKKTKSTTKAKLMGFLNKMKSFRNLTCSYLDILEAIVPISKVLERACLMIYEAKDNISVRVETLERMKAMESVEDDMTSLLQRFCAENCASAQFEFNTPAGKRLKSRTKIDMSYLNYVGEESFTTAFYAKKNLSASIGNHPRKRVQAEYNDEILGCMA